MTHSRTMKSRVLAALFAAGLIVGACDDSSAGEDIVDDNAPNVDQGTDAGDTDRDNDERENVKDAAEPS